MRFELEVEHRLRDIEQFHDKINHCIAAQREHHRRTGDDESCVLDITDEVRYDCTAIFLYFKGEWRVWSEYLAKESMPSPWGRKEETWFTVARGGNFLIEC